MTFSPIFFTIGRIMEESQLAPVSRYYLESLSTDELIKIADSFGVDIPPGLERIFIIEEILETANAEIQETDGQIEENPSYSEPVLLPKRYNISYIEVIIRDPFWVFVFWEIKGHDREAYENAEDFNGYFLRVIKLTKDRKEIEQDGNPFTVSVSKEDNARYLGFAGESLNENSPDEDFPDKTNSFVIKLGVIRGNREIMIASSNPFVLPALSENEKIADLSSNPLLRLSGVQDLSIIKNKNRNTRVKRQQ